MVSDAFIDGFKKGRFERLQQDLQSLGYECWIEGSWSGNICVSSCSQSLAKTLGSSELMFPYNFLALNEIEILSQDEHYKIHYYNNKNGRMILIGSDYFSFSIFQYGWGIKFINDENQKSFRVINRHGQTVYNSDRQMEESEKDVDMIETIVDNIIKSHRLYEKYALN